MQKLACFFLVLLATSVTATDWVKCAKAAIQLGQDVLQLVNDVKAQEMQKIIQDLQTLLSDINTLKTDCGIGEFTPEEFERLSMEIEEQGLNTDWVKCAQAAFKIAQDVAQLVEDAKTGDISKIVADLQQILADIQQLTSACGIGLQQVNTDWIKCGKSVLSLTKHVAKLVADAKTYNIPAIVKDLQNILADINTIKKSCGIKMLFTQDEDDFYLGRDIKACGEDLIQAAKVVIDLVKAVKEQNIKEIIADVQAVMQLVPKIKEDCL